jgi:hypothetical protein
MEKNLVAPLELAAFVAAPREWMANFSTPEMALVVKPLDELTVEAARSLTADVVLIEFDTLSDDDLLAILAACPTALHIGLTEGLPENQIRVVELLMDRVAPVDGPPMVIAWTVWSAARQAGEIAMEPAPVTTSPFVGGDRSGNFGPQYMSQEHWKTWRRLDAPEPTELLCELHARSSDGDLNWEELELN